MTDTEITFFDYIGIILKYRKLVLGISFLAAIIALLFSIFSGSSFVAEAKLWSDTPGRTVEFLKSREVLDGIIEKFHLFNVYGLKDIREVRKQVLMDLNVSFKGNVIMLVIKAPESVLAVNMANEFVVRTLEQEAKFSAGILENQKKTAENKWAFAVELFEKSPIKKEVNLSAFPQISPDSPPFASVLNKATPVVASSRIFLIVRNILFGAVFGAFFGILLAFMKEYGSRHKAEWIETKRKYLNK